MSFGQQFLAGQRFAQGLVETYQSAKQRRALEEIADAKPQQADEFTAEQGEKIQQVAADPTKHIGYDNGIKAYMSVPKLADNEMGPAQPVEIARASPMTDFLGKRTAGAMTADQVSSAKFKAMADVVAKGDPIQGMRLQREVMQGEREDRKAREEEEFQKALQAEYGNSIFAKKMGEFAPQMQAYQQADAQYKARLQAGESPQSLGLPPQAPQRPAYSVAESLADNGRLLALKASKGKADPAELMKYAEAFKKVSDEGYGQALRLAQSGAPLAKVAEQFNQVGGVKFDPAAVVSDEIVKGADGVPARVIKYRDQAGQVHTINALSELDSIGQAEGYFSRFNKNRDFGLKERELEEVKIRNAEARAEMASMRAAIAQSRGAGAALGSAPVWDDKADAYLRDRYTVKDPATGEVRVDGSGLQFGKTLALAVSQANGGDSTRGVGYAFEKDNELRAAATDPKGQYDAGRHAQLRKQYLAALTAPQQTSAPPAPSAPQPGESAKPKKQNSAKDGEGKKTPPPAPAYAGGRPATMQAFVGSKGAGAAQPTAEPTTEPARAVGSPQSLGDDFASPMARQALAARVADAANGGAPLSKIETLRAKQLRLL